MQRRSVMTALGLSALLLNSMPLSAQEGRTPFVVWYALKAPYGDEYGQMLKGYETSHPYLSLQLRNFGDSESLRVALEANAPMPDVVLVDDAWQDQLIQDQKIVPVQDLMAAASSMATIVAKVDTFTSLYNLSCRDAKLWTLPTFASDTALVYNTDTFAAKSLKKPPANWGELVTDAKMLTHADHNQWGFQVPMGAAEGDLGQMYSLMMWQMGADLMNTSDQAPPLPVLPPNPDGTPAAPPPPPPVTASSSPSERLVAFLSDLVYKYHVSPVDAPDDPSCYAMCLGTPETLLSAEGKGLHMMAAPFPINKIKVEALTVYSLAVTKDARDKNEAYQFSKWAADFEQSVNWTTSAPFLPANKQVTLSPQYFQFLTQHPGMRVFLTEMNVGRLEPIVPHYKRILHEIGDQLKSALAQHQDAGERAIASKTHYLQNQPQSSLPATAPEQ